MFDVKSYETFLLDHSLVGFFDPPIVLKSGRPGHWYANMRYAYRTQELKRQLACYVYDFCSDLGLKPDHFLGVPDGANPLAEELNTMIGYKVPSEIPASILRSGSKSHGDPQDRYSVGPLKSGDHVVLVEDVTTTGGSSMRPILWLQELGVWIDMLVSCVNRYERRSRGSGVGRTVQDVLERDYHVKYAALTHAPSILPKAVERFKPSSRIREEIEDYYRVYGVSPIELPKVA